MNPRRDVSIGDPMQQLADVVVQDIEGNDVRLFKLWSDRPAVLVFVRHYG